MKLTRQKLSSTPVLLLASLSLFWGLNWPGMKIILSEMTVWWFRAMCLVVGGILLLSLSAMSGNRWRPFRREIKPIMFCGTFAVLGWMVFSAYGVSLMPAGRASIIAFTMPVWASLLAAPILGERITPVKIGGLLLGVAGLATLIGPDLIILQQAPLGALCMLGAAMTWAMGTVLIKRINWEIPVLSNIAWQLLYAAVPVTTVAILLEPLPDLTTLSTPAIIAIIYIFIGPMSYCQWAYFKSVTLLPASIAAIGTLTIPIVGVYSSHLILGEPVGIYEVIALLLVLSALALVLLVPALKARAK